MEMITVTQKEKEYYRRKIINFLKENGIGYKEKLYFIEIKSNLKSISAWESMTLVFMVNRKELEINMKDDYTIIRYNNNSITIPRVLVRYNKGNIEIYV